MADTVWVTSGIIIAVVFLLILIIVITIIYCYKRSYHIPTILKYQGSIRSINTHEDSRSNSSTSCIDNAYHTSTTLLASNRRFVIFELQQQQDEQDLNPLQTFAYDNASCDLNELTTNINPMRF